MAHELGIDEAERERERSVEMEILVEKVDSFYIRRHLEATVVVADQLDRRKFHKIFIEFQPATNIRLDI